MQSSAPQPGYNKNLPTLGKLDLSFLNLMDAHQIITYNVDFMQIFQERGGKIATDFINTLVEMRNLAERKIVTHPLIKKSMQVLNSGGVLTDDEYTAFAENCMLVEQQLLTQPLKREWQKNLQNVGKALEEIYNNVHLAKRYDLQEFDRSVVDSFIVQMLQMSPEKHAKCR